LRRRSHHRAVRVKLGTRTNWAGTMRHFLTASALLVLASCSPTAPRPGLVIATDAMSYSVSAGGSRMVRFVGTNHSDGTLYILDGCIGADVQSANGMWTPYGYGGLCIGPMGTGATLRLSADGQFADSLSFGIPGRYRISVPYSTDSLATSYPPAHSNAFTIDSAP
jgi:hypothetical protein